MQIKVKAPAILLLVMAFFITTTVQADEYKAEIEYLLSTVGNGDCLFVRNGKEHSAEDGESHLRMKYRKGARYIDSTEIFIEKVASQSSWSGKPYRVRCPGEAEQASASWLATLLAEYRQTKQVGRLANQLQ